MSQNADHQQELAATPLPLLGKDEMNFAEFPIALLTDRVPKGQKSLKYEDQIYDAKRRKIVTRRRIIEGSEEYGLPTATDDTVVLALIQLTKQKTDFKRKEVEFSRHELIRKLGWKNEGKNYDRIKLSLQRIANVTYNYDNAWWDNRQQTWTTKIFHILDTVEINDSRSTYEQGGLFPSRIVWNEVVFDSFQANFVRDLDFQLCMQLKHPISLRMYRFLGKRFYRDANLTFDLKELCHPYIGLGNNYEGGKQLARKLKPAIEELENVGFLEPMSEDERFVKNKRDWTIRLIQKRPAAFGLPALIPDAEQPETEPTHELVDELGKRGVSKTKAARLVRDYSVASILAKVDIFDWMQAAKDKRVGRNPAGYLVKSIEEEYLPPADFVSKAEREQVEKVRRASQNSLKEKRRQERQQEAYVRAERKQVDSYLKQLSPEERAALEDAAISKAGAEEKASYNDPAMAIFRDTLKLGMVRDYVQRLLAELAMPEV